MTAIVGIRDGRKVWLGGDGLATDGSLNKYPSEPKVWKVGEYVLGHSGSGRDCQIMRHFFRPPPPVQDRPLFAHMVVSVVPELRKVLSDAGVSVDPESSETDNAVLLWAIVGIRGQLFSIEARWTVYEHRHFAATGGGESWAIGSLSETAGLPPKTRILRALSCAAKYNAGVGRPFTIVHTGG